MRLPLFHFALSLAFCGSLYAAEAEKLSLGGLSTTAPADWVRKTPRFDMIAYEFSTPPAAEDEAEGRVTVMTAAGSVEANIQRWIGQFVQADGSNTADRAKTEKRSIAGREVHLLDVSGTYRDAPRPMAPPVLRADYRMLAAVVPSDAGVYFFKFYGPKRTVEKHAAGFRAMIEGLK